MTYNIKPQTKNQVLSTILLHTIFGFFLATLLLNTIRLMQQFVYRKQVLARQEDQKKKLKLKQDELTYRLKRSQTESYVEERARELTLAKPNEAILIGAYPSPTRPPKNTIKKVGPPLEEWKKVFVH
jgi:cell division protein FtsB